MIKRTKYGANLTEYSLNYRIKHQIIPENCRILYIYSSINQQNTNKMRTKFNQLFYTFFFIIGLGTSAWAGITPANPILAYSPSNPVAGQTVTFTVPESSVSSCEIVSVAPDLENNPALLLDLTLAAGYYTTTYVYPSPGTYQVGYDLNVDNCLTGRNQPKNSRELQTFDFGPIDGGPFVTATDNGTFISSPLVIGAPIFIPTLGQWGIIILGLLSTIFGVVMMNEKYFKLAKSKS